MTIPWPPLIDTCTVSGRLVQQTVDATNPAVPANEPVRGMVVFTASIAQTSTTGLPEELLVSTHRPIVAALDVDGRFSVDLAATDTPYFGVTDWTWRAEFQLENHVHLKPFNFQLETGNNYLLTDLVPITESPGVITTRGPGGTIAIGTVTSVPFGQGSTVVNVGTPENAVLNIEVETGPQGNPGESDSGYSRSFLFGGM